MAKTLLDGVNDLFKLADLIAGDQGALTSLTDSPRQHDIDASVIAINQTIDELYSTAEISLPKQLGEDNITLVTNTRNYTLHTNFNRMHFPLIDRVNTQYIWE